MPRLRDSRHPDPLCPKALFAVPLTPNWMLTEKADPLNVIPIDPPTSV